MNFITIENKSGKVRLNETVTPDSIKRMIDQIGRLFGADATASGADFGPMMACVENAINSLDIEINSPGGSVFDGYTIYNEIKSLRERGVKVNATITGMAASMASVICMACDVVKIVPHGRMMIHDASNAVAGNAEKMRMMADLLDGISSDISDIYAERTGKGSAVIRAMMKAETWMNAKEAKALGFIDEILTGDAPKNSVDFAPDARIPADMSFLDRLTSPSNVEAQERIVALELTISNHGAEVSELQAKLDAAETALQEAANVSVENKALALTVADQLVTIEAHSATITAQSEQIVTLTAANVVTAEKIDLAAATKLAAMGHGEPLDLSGSGEVINHLEVHNSLSGAERTAYYAKHEAAIRAQLSK